MRPAFHFFIALAVSVLLCFLDWRWWQIFLFFTGAFFIDVDHYMYYVAARRSWSLKKACRWFIAFEKTLKKTGKNFEFLMAFHNLETFAALALLSCFWFAAFFPLLLGFLIHNAADIAHFMNTGEKRYKRAPSIILYIFKAWRKAKKTKGKA